jgi:hypothetical protein
VKLIISLIKPATNGFIIVAIVVVVVVVLQVALKHEIRYESFHLHLDYKNYSADWVA